MVGCTKNEVVCKIGGKETAVKTDYDAETHCLYVELPEMAVTQEAVLTFVEPLKLAQNDVAGKVYAFLDQAEMRFDDKTAIYELVSSKKSPLVIVGRLQTMGLSEDLVKCLTELIGAQG